MKYVHLIVNLMLVIPNEGVEREMPWGIRSLIKNLPPF